MQNKRILVVDDSRVIIESVRLILEDAGYDVMSAQSGEEALGLIRKKGLPHLALVDLQMSPRMDGFTFCKHVGQFSDLPVIILTGTSDEATVVKGLQHYAEAYVLKPFRSAELLARIEVVLRRIGEFAYPLSPVIRVDDRLEINLAQRQACVENHYKALTPIEAKFLYLLMKYAGRTVQTAYLLQRIWPHEDVYEDRLHAHVYRLRKKIEVNPKKPHYIVSDWARGYQFPGLENKE